MISPNPKVNVCCKKKIQYDQHTSSIAERKNAQRLVWGVGVHLKEQWVDISGTKSIAKPKGYLPPTYCSSRKNLLTNLDVKDKVFKDSESFNKITSPTSSTHFKFVNCLT
jgi:hypothetical protein